MSSIIQNPIFIDASGNVGIGGIPAASVKLSIQQNNTGGDASFQIINAPDAYTNLSSTATLYLGATGYGGVNGCKIMASHSDGGVGNHGQNLRFYYVDAGSAPVEGIRITSTGYVGINDNSPQYRLSLVGTHSITNAGGGFVFDTPVTNNANRVLKFFIDGNSHGNLDMWTGVTNVASPSNSIILGIGGSKVGIGINPTVQLDLSTDGARKLTTNTWATGSDIRLKENIELANLDICYNVIKNLPLKRFSWKSSISAFENISDRNVIGWIAQDVQSILPNAVTSSDEYGVDGCLSLQPDQIYKIMYGALQKNIILVEELSAKNDALEARLLAAGI